MHMIPAPRQAAEDVFGESSFGGRKNVLES